MSPSRSRLAATALALALAGAGPVVAASPSGGTDGAPDRRVGSDLRLDFDRGPKRAGDVVRATRNSGRLDVRAVAVRAFDGEARRAKGRYSRWSLRLPRFVDGNEPPRATLSVTSRRRDPLSPRNRDFVIGIDFWLNGASSGQNADDGDNLLQRGAYRSRAQYKLQADDAVPLCRVKGSVGAVVVSAEPVTRRQWHRMLCERSGTELTLTVWRLDADGPTLLSEVTGSGEIGSVDDERGVPLSVGGRLRDNGTVPLRAGDQFNGLVDRVVYDRR
jgi:hypothetical protein